MCLETFMAKADEAYFVSVTTFNANKCPYWRPKLKYFMLLLLEVMATKLSLLEEKKKT